MEKKIYKNWQSDIAFKFSYETDEELHDNLTGMLFSVLQFVSDYNLSDELIEELNDRAEYFLGEDFKAINTAEFKEWLGDWMESF